MLGMFQDNGLKENKFAKVLKMTTSSANVENILPNLN